MRNDKVYNENDELTIFGLYENVREELEEVYLEEAKKNGHSPLKKLKYKTFYQVVTRYLKYCIMDAVDSYFGIDWYFGLGKLKMVSFIPKKAPKVRSFFNGKSRIITLDLNKTDGYFSYLMWICNDKRYKKFTTRFKLDKIYKKKIKYNIFKLGKRYESLENVS